MAANWFPIILIGKVPLTRLTVYGKEVILPVFHLRFLFNGRYEALSVVETIPPSIPGLVRSPLDPIDQSESAACAR